MTDSKKSKKATPPGTRSRSRRADLARDRKKTPLWLKLLGVSAVPLIGFGIIGWMVGSGGATFDDEHFFGNLPRVIIGAIALGVALHMALVRFSKHGRDMTGLARIGALALFLVSSLIALYVLAPRNVTTHVDAGFRWTGNLFGEFVDYVRGDDPEPGGD